LVTPEGVVYHNGFTGTSLFMHPESGRYVGVLTNAVHYGRDRVGLVDLRAAARSALAPQAHDSQACRGQEARSFAMSPSRNSASPAGPAPTRSAASVTSGTSAEEAHSRRPGTRRVRTSATT